jgi:hypothetical protein
MEFLLQRKQNNYKRNTLAHLGSDSHAKTIDNGDEGHTWLPFIGTFAKLKKASVRFVVSVCLSAWNNSAPTGWSFMKTDTSVFF